MSEVDRTRPVYVCYPMTTDNKGQENVDDGKTARERKKLQEQKPDKESMAVGDLQGLSIFVGTEDLLR